MRFQRYQYLFFWWYRNRASCNFFNRVKNIQERNQIQDNCLNCQCSTNWATRTTLDQHNSPRQLFGDNISSLQLLALFILIFICLIFLLFQNLTTFNNFAIVFWRCSKWTTKVFGLLRDGVGYSNLVEMKNCKSMRTLIN